MSELAVLSPPVPADPDSLGIRAAAKTAACTRPVPRRRDPLEAIVEVASRTIVAAAKDAALRGAGTTSPPIDPWCWADGAPDVATAAGRVVVRSCLAASRLHRAGFAGSAGIALAPGADELTDDEGVTPDVSVVAPRHIDPGEPQVVGMASRLRPVSDPAGVTPRRAGLARAAVWLEVIGVIVLLFLPYQWWGTGFEQARAQRHLRAAWAAARHPVPDIPTVAAPQPSRPALAALVSPRLPDGIVARLQIPAIGVDQLVVDGTGTDALRKGPGHYPGSPFPGQRGNVAIAGHRTTYGAPFNRLDELKVGDPIVATTPTGRFTYTVSQQPFSVLPTDIGVVNDQGDDRLTLTTCTPKFSASHRLIIVAKLDNPVAPPAPGVAQPGGSGQGVVGASFAPLRAQLASASRQTVRADALKDESRTWRWAALPGVLVWLVPLVALGLAYRPARRRFPPWASLVLLMPLWGWALLGLYEHLARVLPASL